MKRYLILSVITMVVSVVVLQVARFGNASTVSITQTTTSTSSGTTTTSSSAGTADHFFSSAAAPAPPCVPGFADPIKAYGSGNQDYNSKFHITIQACGQALSSVIIGGAGSNNPTDGILCSTNTHYPACPTPSNDQYQLDWGPLKSPGTFTGVSFTAGGIGGARSVVNNFSLTVSSATPCQAPQFTNPSGTTFDTPVTYNTSNSAPTLKVSNAGPYPLGVKFTIQKMGGTYSDTFNANPIVSGTAVAGWKLDWPTFAARTAGTYSIGAIGTCGSQSSTPGASAASYAFAKLVVPEKAPSPPPDTTPSGETGTTGTGSTGAQGTTVSSAQYQQTLLTIPQYRAVAAAPQVTELKISAANPKLDKQKGVTGVDFKGKAKSNTKYSLLVFSEPKQLDFTSDKDGNWSVELKDSLPAGQHEAYVVLNDKSGKPLQRSSAISFLIPTAEAAKASAIASITPTQNSVWKLYALYSGLTVLASIMIFGVYETIKRRLSKKMADSDIDFPPTNTITPPTGPTPPEV